MKTEKPVEVIVGCAKLLHFKLTYYIISILIARTMSIDST
jgi:hypothetical protein